MDSLTQIVLGAAVGEVVLGKKLGNRAMVWGAIGGTIPDLDIMVNLFADDMTALAAHRGLSHSFFFAFVGSILFAYLTHKLFSSGLYKEKWYRVLIAVLQILFISLFLTIIYGISTIISNDQNPILGIVLVGMIIYMGRYIYRSYTGTYHTDVGVTFREWYWFYFWTICTHFILDAFTSYGTQVFQPFSNYKAAFNTISVADPLYTVPFLICLILAGRYHRATEHRSKWNWAGIAVSSIYLTLTVFNKIRVDQIFEDKFAARGVQYEQFTAGPSILNNALWTGTVETDTAFHTMMLSIFDDREYQQHINVIPKNHELIDSYRDTREIQTLEWFTNGFYTITELEKDYYQLSDLRYGAMRDTVQSNEDFVFQFFIDARGEEFSVTENRNRSTDGNILGDLWTRIKGYPVKE